jgi:iron-sulfur cluster assembly protein
MASPALLSPYGTCASDPVADTLLLIVRFSASIPDLPLDVPSPETTTGAGLKQLIRAELPSNLSTHRLRLIYAGRGLEDSTALVASLKLPPSPSRTPDPDEQDEATDSPNGKEKGKQAVRDTRPRIYIHCSIGDIALSESDLAAEAAMASTLLVQKQKEVTSPLHSVRESPPPPPTTIPAPRGFDRLLSAGFTAAEVTALRSQFLAVQSVSRTPDTMPTGEELRDLEDRWMDEGSTAAWAQAGGEGGGGDDDGGFGSGSRSAMDDMLWGAVMGFFWPIGCAMWLRREEGVWSWRKGVAVFVGVVVNAAFGAMRIMN